MVSAVITGDIVHSTRLSPDSEKKLLRGMKQIQSPYVYEFYRGDSFQVYLKDAAPALKIIFLLRCIAKRLDQSGEGFDIKSSLGIGKVKSPVKQLSSAKGEAFLLSGRQFDGMDWTYRRTAITTGHHTIDIAMGILSDYADDIFERMTFKQAAVIFELLSGRKQDQIARQLNKAQSTISKQVTGGGWNKLQDLLVKFDQLIQLLKP